MGEEVNLYELKKSNLDESDIELFQLNLGDYKLAEVGEVKDYFDISYVDENGYKKITNVNYFEKSKLHIADKNDSISVTSSNTTGVNRFMLALNDIRYGVSASSLVQMYCNIAKAVTRDNTYQLIEGIAYGATANYKYIYMYFDETKEMTADEFKAWLISKNAKFLYQLQEPMTTKVTDENLIAQLEKLINTMTYKEVTNISTSKSLDVEEVAELKVSVDYLKSARIERKKLNERLTVLEEKVNSLLNTTSEESEVLI